MASYGRLPRLQSIGKSQRVCDAEEPPPLSKDSDSDETAVTPSPPTHQPVRQFCLNFEPEDGSRAAKALGETFRVLNPGGHICMRNRTYGTSFSHCRRSIALSKTYCELRMLLEGRARVQLIRDYTSRIHAISMFVDELQGLVEQEFSAWQSCCLSGARLEATNLEYLSVVCEDMRIHINHWNSVKQRLHTDIWLRSQLPHLCHELEFVRVTLLKLRDRALFWAEKLLKIGLKVFSHLDVASISPECLWSITRGLEEFNSILTFVKASYPHSRVTLPRMEMAATDQAQENWHSRHSNTISVSVHTMNSFSKILASIANERSKSAAYIARDFFLSSEEFIDLLQKMKPTEFSWSEQDDETTQDCDLEDTGSQGSLTLSLLKVGDHMAPDLSTHSSPLLAFIGKEREFAENFLSAVCQCTNLLRRSGGTLTKQNTLLDTCSPPIETSESKRKSVSWGDTMDVNVKVQLLSRYMDTLWRSFGGYLYEYVYQHVWGSVCLQERLLGHVHHASTQAIVMVTQIMRHTSAKDLFPSASIGSILSVADKLVTMAAINAWDRAFSAALSESVVDRLGGTPLGGGTGGVYCTKTAKLFLESYQPLYRVCFMVVNTRLQRAEADERAGFDQSDLWALHASLSRVLVTSRRVLSWASTQANQLLVAWNVHAFLLVAQSDLKILGDEITRILHLTQSVCSADCSSSVEYSHSVGLPHQTHSGHYYQEDIHQLWSEINSVNAQFQSLSGCLLKQFGLEVGRLSDEFFERWMPTGKVWKVKSQQEFPSEANEYVYKALSQILEPVIVGGARLTGTAQLALISITVTKMCEAWTGFILKEKIRFSLHGACQLQVDFDYVRLWLEGFIENDEVKQSILSLDVLKYLMGVVSLLKRQPPRNAQSRRDEAKGVDYYTSASPTDHTPPSGDSSTHSSPTLSHHDVMSGDTDSDLTAHYVTNADEWLALRVNGGSRNWKITTCFNP